MLSIKYLFSQTENQFAISIWNYFIARYSLIMFVIEVTQNFTQGLWSLFTSSNLHKYYYNSKTRETTLYLLEVSKRQVKPQITLE